MHAACYGLARQEQYVSYVSDLSLFMAARNQSALSVTNHWS